MPEERKGLPSGSPWADAVRRLARNRMAAASVIFLSIMVILAILAPWIAPYHYAAQDLALGASPPAPGHLLGTDEAGRDVLARILMGGRISLMVAFAATAVAFVIGVAYGALAGFTGGRMDSAMMRLVDILYALPFTILVIILMVFFGQSIVLLFAAIGAVEWLTMARIVRSQILTLKHREFVEAAHALGIGQMRILFRHLLPNALGPIIVYATLIVPQVILVEAFVSFLGLGVQAPMPSWGTLIGDGARLMEENPWLLIFPSSALSLTLFCLNFLGDGLRDALDPRTIR